MENGVSRENLSQFPGQGWRKRTAVFLLSQGISLFGSSMVNFAIVWYVTLRTSSGAVMTITILTSFLPQIIISLFSGVWADRYNRKYVIIASDALTAAATLILGILFMSGMRELWIIFTASAVRSIGAGVQSPAESAIFPQLVPQEKLMRVNGINGSIQSFITLLSPAAGGFVLAVFSVETAFLVDVATAALAIIILSVLRIPPHSKAAEKSKTGVFEDFRQGIAFIKGNAPLKSLLIYYAVFFFLISPAAFLTPLLIERSYGPEVWKLTANEILYSAGAIAGGLLMASWGGFRSRLRTIALACTAYGVSAVLLGLSTSFYFYLTVMFFTGIFSPVFYAAETVLIQETVDSDMQGRIFSIIEIIILAVMPVGMLIFGPSADVVRVETLMILTGILMIALGGFVFLKNIVKSSD